MKKFLREIMIDLNFIRSHELQPKWYKIFKIFMLLGILTGYYFLFGIQKTLVFAGIFFLLSFLMHMLYRIKTNRFTQSWMDFHVNERSSDEKPQRMGLFYYSIVVVNFILAVLISQVI